MMTDTIQSQVFEQILQFEAEDKIPVAVMLGHEDWLIFAEQSQVAYTPFGSARRYQPALGGLLLVRVDEMHKAQVMTQSQLDDYALTNQIL